MYTCFCSSPLCKRFWPAFFPRDQHQNPNGFSVSPRIICTLSKDSSVPSSDAQMICGGQPGGAKIKDMAPQHFATWTTNGPQMDHKSGRILLCSSVFCFAFKISRHQFSTNP